MKGCTGRSTKVGSVYEGVVWLLYTGGVYIKGCPGSLYKGGML